MRLSPPASARITSTLLSREVDPGSVDRTGLLPRNSAPSLKKPDAATDDTSPESVSGDPVMVLASADLPVAVEQTAAAGEGGVAGLQASGAVSAGGGMGALSSLQLLGISLIPVSGAVMIRNAGTDTPAQPFTAQNTEVTALVGEETVSGNLSATGAERGTVTYRLVGTADPEVAIASDGTFTVAGRAQDQALDEGETRTVTFQYVANDGLRDSAPATVTVTLTGRNDAPVGQDTTLSGMADGGTVGGQVSATDADAEPLTYALVGEPPAGVVFNTDGTFSVSPQAEDLNLSGSGSRVVTFQYVANDGTTDSAPATVTVTIMGQNHAPQAVDEIFATDYLTPISRSLLDNDSDPDGDTLTVTNWSWNGQGTVSVDAGGWLNYSPDGAAGYAEVMYTVSDGHGGESSAVARISVDGPVDGGGGGGNNNPTASDDGTFFLDSQSALSLFPLQNDGDPDGDPLTLVGAYLSYGGGSVSVQGDGSIYYSADGYSGDAGIYYTVDDGRGGQSSAMMILSVSPVNGGGDGGGDYGGGDGGGEPVNQTPSAQDDILSTSYLSDISWNVISNDGDPDGDPLSIISWYWNGTGSAFLEVNGQLSYSPQGTAGSAQITYTVDDGRGGQATANVWISVDGPVDGVGGGDGGGSSDNPPPEEPALFMTLALGDDPGIDLSGLLVPAALSPDGPVDFGLAASEEELADLFIRTGDAPDQGLLLTNFFSGDDAAPLPTAYPVDALGPCTDLAAAELMRLMAAQPGLEAATG